MLIRAASTESIPDLVTLENASFESDRLSRRQFRYMLTRAHAALLVAEEDEHLLGYVLVLFSRGTSMARLYSLAVDPAARGRGVGRALIEAAEAATWNRERACLRLEVRQDNDAAVRLYESMGYRRFGRWTEYYEDRETALRYEKRVGPGQTPGRADVPYYEQTLDFTCGPAALMMAMAALDDGVLLDRKTELRLWREATTIFMTSGHGGCGPFGLALAASRRGFRVEIHVNDCGVVLVDSVRSQPKKEVIRLVQEDMVQELRSRRVPIRYQTLPLGELEQRLAAGTIPLVLISSWQIYEEKFPHWVVVTGFDDHFVYVNDPYVDRDAGETATDSIHMPVARRPFERMARYGKAGLQAVLLISSPRPGGFRRPRLRRKVARRVRVSSPRLPARRTHVQPRDPDRRRS